MLVDMRAEIWKTIDGYDGRYQVNPLGEVRRVCKRKNAYMTAYLRRGGWFVKLSMNRESREHKVAHLVAEAFLPKRKEGQVLWHKNGVLSDNFAGNLQWISCHDLGKKTALLADKRRTVAKVAQNGEAVGFYRSARAAARDNHMSYQTVLDRCNGKVKKPFALDGHNYIFSDDLVI
jgi:hypothetical protein